MEEAKLRTSRSSNRSSSSSSRSSRSNSSSSSKNSSSSSGGSSSSSSSSSSSNGKSGRVKSSKRSQLSSPAYKDRKLNLRITCTTLTHTPSPLAKELMNDVNSPRLKIACSRPEGK